MAGETEDCDRCGTERPIDKLHPIRGEDGEFCLSCADWLVEFEGRGWIDHSERDPK